MQNLHEQIHIPQNQDKRIILVTINNYESF